MGARFYDLRSNIQAAPQRYNYSIILRISLLTLDISNIPFILRAAEFIEILLVIFYSDSKREYISGVLFVNISAVIMQVFLMVYSFIIFSVTSIRKKSLCFLHIKFIGYLIGYSCWSH